MGEFNKSLIYFYQSLTSFVPKKWYFLTFFHFSPKNRPEKHLTEGQKAFLLCRDFELTTTADKKNGTRCAEKKTFLPLR